MLQCCGYHLSRPSRHFVAGLTLNTTSDLPFAQLCATAPPPVSRLRCYVIYCVCCMYYPVVHSRVCRHFDPETTMCLSSWSYFAEGNGMAPSSPHVLRHDNIHASRFLVLGYDQKSHIERVSAEQPRGPHPQPLLRRKHHHGTARTVPNRQLHVICGQGEMEYVGVDGGCNDDVGAQGTYQINGRPSPSRPDCRKCSSLLARLAEW